MTTDNTERQCEGFPYWPCPNPATQKRVAFTSNDLETRLALDFWFCDNCATQWDDPTQPVKKEPAP